MNQLNELLTTRDSLVKKLGEMEYRYNQMSNSSLLVRRAFAERIVKKNLEINENTKQINSLVVVVVD